MRTTLFLAAILTSSSGVLAQAPSPLSELGKAIADGSKDWANQRRAEEAAAREQAERAAERDDRRREAELYRANQLEVERIRAEGLRQLSLAPKQSANPPPQSAIGAAPDIQAEVAIKQEGYLAFSRLLVEATGPALSQVIRSDGISTAIASRPAEFWAAAEVITSICSDIEELRRITATAITGRNSTRKAFDPSLEQHVRLLAFMRTQCDLFKSSGGAALTKDGKSFLTRDEYYTLPADQRGNHWTFTIDDIVDMLVASAKSRIEAQSALHFKRPSPTQGEQAKAR